MTFGKQGRKKQCTQDVQMTNAISQVDRTIHLPLPTPARFAYF